MRQVFLALTLHGGIVACLAQNLVVNPSFEDHLSCPNEISQIDSVPGWSYIWLSPDYFNACADDTVSVPYNAAGYQMPSDGQGYAGLSFGPDVYSKEYMQGTLLAPLQPGVPAHVSMRVSPGGFGYPNFTSPAYACSHVGLRFSTQPFTFQQWPYGYFHFNTAVLYMPTVLNDTSAWTVLSTDFIPDSAYAYVQIGNFFADSLCAWAVLDPNESWYAAYAFVDMVCVSHAEGVCDPVQGLQGIGMGHPPSNLVFTDVLELQLAAWGLEGSVVRAGLYDMGGRVVAQRGLNGARGTVPWALTGLATGQYVLQLVSHDRPPFSVRSFKIEP